MKTPLASEGSFIVDSLLDTDFYKFPMGQFIFNHYPDTEVTFEFMNRTGTPLARHISESDLRRELDHAMALRFNNSELHYLRGTNEYGERMFGEPYLQFLKGVSLPPYELKYRGDNISLRFPGPWRASTYWEIPSLKIMNELLYRAHLENLTRFQRDALYAEGQKRLERKIEILRQNSEISFSDFGTRRAFSVAWHDYVVGVLAEELPSGQFRGTSNTLLAMKYGLLPMGTNAHEIQMVMAGLTNGDEELRESPHRFLDMWWDDYGEALAIILPDTFGSPFMMKTISEKNLKRYKGFRQDSGDPRKECEQWIALYENHGIDPRSKLGIPSDGLDLRKMLELTDMNRERLIMSHGWGTNLTNDLGVDPVSMVTKAVIANGRGLVKLSNNLAKAMGPEEEIRRYKQVFGYENKSRVKTVY
ncbi:MAG: nicotinate phosphoribosyltransferase [Candidatus Paceibacterota bacterium]|jgi:nicotinate phosphoribosyltransferase